MNLSQLIEETIARYEELKWQTFNEGTKTLNDVIPDFLKTELEKIVKESFKNTRVEEKEVKLIDLLGTIKNEKRPPYKKIYENNRKIGYNQALSDKHNKECEFLGK